MTPRYFQRGGRWYLHDGEGRGIGPMQLEPSEADQLEALGAESAVWDLRGAADESGEAR